MRKNEKGFTLIEVVLVMTLAALLLIPVGSLFLSNLKGYITSDEQNNIQDKAQQIMEAFRTDSLYARGIHACVINGVDDLTATTTGDNSFVITVDMPSSNPESKVYKTYVYDYVNNTFTKYDGNGMSGKQLLTVDNVTVRVTPVVKKEDEARAMFKLAAGVNVSVGLSKPNVGIKKTTELLELTNSFYFRNSNVDPQDLTIVVPEASGAVPTPIKIETQTIQPADTPKPTPFVPPGPGETLPPGVTYPPDYVTPTPEVSPTPTPTPEPVVLNVNISYRNNMFYWTLTDKDGKTIDENDQYRFDLHIIPSKFNISQADIHVSADSSITSTTGKGSEFTNFGIYLEDWASDEVSITVYNELPSNKYININCYNYTNCDFKVVDKIHPYDPYSVKKNKTYQSTSRD